MNYLVLKRILDIIFSLIFIVLTLPLLLLVLLITFFNLGLPLIDIRIPREGKNKKPFYMYKIRTRIYDQYGNSHYNKISKFIDNTGLNELPQLFNILKGDMSFIGPRPLLKEYLSFYTPRQNMRHTIRPGLECPSLVERDHPRTWEEQFEDDVWYVENINVKTDFRMFCKLFKMVLNKNDSKRRAKASRGYFGAMTIDEITKINRGYKESLK